MDNLRKKVEEIRSKIKGYDPSKAPAVPIVDCGEPLVQVPSEVVVPYCANMLSLEDRRMFLRKGVMERYLKAAEEVKKHHGIDLMVLDGWRDLAIQEALYWIYLKEYTAPQMNFGDKFSPEMTAEEVKAVYHQLPIEDQKILEEEHVKYVAMPCGDPKCPSQHNTGGSIDVWPYKDGSPLDLGVEFDQMDESAGVFYHLEPGNKFEDNQEVCRNREILITAMVNAGFSVYPFEIWHFNYGTQLHALFSDWDHAIYTVCKPE